MSTPMPGPPAVIIHSKNGELGPPPLSSAADVAKALEDALAAAPPRGLVVHFHGGLVSAEAGTQIAVRLNETYRAAGTVPFFFVWESGLLESLRNNLSDILADPAFRELTKKAGEWVSKQLPGAFASRGAGQAVDEYTLRDEFDAWFSGQRAAPPVTLDTYSGPTGKAAVPDEDDLAANIEASLDNDPGFQRVLSGLSQNSGRGTVPTKGMAGPAAANVPVLVDRNALDQLFGPPAPGQTKGLVTWFKVARFVAKVVIAVIGRHNAHRDHGTYTTLVEEILRAAYLDRVGQIVWNMMKKDTADAFSGPRQVGRVLLRELARQQRADRRFTRITLVGHSTGAVYICHWLQSALTELPGVGFDVIFLAPACRFELFAQTIEKVAGGLQNFRMFAMHDALESQDRLVPIVYPRSLLYFVSGLLEGEPDVPILGMERFLTSIDVFTGSDFPGVEAARAWLAQDARRCVWSDDTRSGGFGTLSHTHGDFDDDATTLGSVQYAIKAGF